MRCALHWLYPGQHLPAAVAHNNAVRASVRADGYDLILLAFPVIGLLIGLAGGALRSPKCTLTHRRAAAVRRARREPAPDPPGGIRLPAAGADERLASLSVLAEDSPYPAEPALPRAG